MGTYRGMITGHLTRLATPLVLTACSLGGAALVPAVASAEPCPDVQVVFARGTGEDPGVGPTGQAFV
nr:cutinase family protein [Mycobacterium shigaense]